MVAHWHLDSFRSLIHIHSLLLNYYLHHALGSVSLLEGIAGAATWLLLVIYEVTPLLAVQIVHEGCIRGIVPAQVIRGLVVLIILQVIWKVRFEGSFAVI